MGIPDIHVATAASAVQSSKARPHGRECWANLSARRYGSSAMQALESTGHFEPCEGGRQKVDKRTYFGGPCLEGTLRKPTRCFRIKPRGRGDSGIKSLSKHLMPDAHESCRKAPSQPHNCSRFIVYTKPSGKAQEAIAFFPRKFTGLVPRLRLSHLQKWMSFLEHSSASHSPEPSIGPTTRTMRRITDTDSLSWLRCPQRLKSKTSAESLYAEGDSQ